MLEPGRVVITEMNAMRQRVNVFARRLLGHPEGDWLPDSGDTLLVKQNTFLGDGRTVLANGNRMIMEVFRLLPHLGCVRIEGCSLTETGADISAPFLVPLKGLGLDYDEYSRFDEARAEATGLPIVKARHDAKRKAKGQG
jgi:hypothetical protein